MSHRGRFALIVVGLILVGLVAGAVVGALGIGRPWLYVVLVVLTIIVVPPVVRYRERHRR
ncbi:hypothetical protein ACSHWB_42300 [Lentzea sp. HUAS TT2]|uniref:hypothetical protein n=1 Tax=Lentzea sp. HUAS TT2 TaxID=3447454 RepID=UPI003F72F40D